MGPDNGLLIPATEANGGVVEARELANPDYALPSVSRTFHGRDLFSPAAAHLSKGVDLAELGPPVALDALVRLDARMRATILYVDTFGNVQLNLTREHLERVGVEPGTTVELVVGADRYYAVTARTFADTRPGDLLLYEDSYRNISLAINRGSAAAILKARAGLDLMIVPERV